MHRSETHWPQPLEFDPSRFEGCTESPGHPLAYIPFGAGPRKCIGRNLAVMETVAVVATLVSRLRFERAWCPRPGPGTGREREREPEVAPGVALRLASLLLRVSPR
eukprot:tig00000157_g9665.t1